MTDRKDRGPGWIETYTGDQFWPGDPRAEDLHIEDIAHALSNTARFGGMTSRFYSVAQHSWIVATACPADAALWGLLHDAAEAYIGDMPRPIKHAPGMESYRAMEKRIMEVVAERFGLAMPEPAAVKVADSRALCTERRDLMAPIVVDDVNWAHGAALAEPFEWVIHPWKPEVACKMFLRTFDRLTA